MLKKILFSKKRHFITASREQFNEFVMFFLFSFVLVLFGRFFDRFNENSVLFAPIIVTVKYIFFACV